jgi:hypothetical protein
MKYPGKEEIRKNGVRDQSLIPEIRSIQPKRSDSSAKPSCDGSPVVAVANPAKDVTHWNAHQCGNGLQACYSVPARLVCNQLYGVFVS